MYVHTKPLSVGSNPSHIPTDSSWLEWSRLEDFSFGISKNKMYQLFGNHQNWEWINQRSIIDLINYSSWYVHVYRREVRRACTHTCIIIQPGQKCLQPGWLVDRSEKYVSLIQKDIIYGKLENAFVLFCLVCLVLCIICIIIIVIIRVYVCVCVCICVCVHTHIHVWAQGDKPQW